MSGFRLCLAILTILLAGQSVPGAVVTFSGRATYLSGVNLLGSPTSAFVLNISTPDSAVTSSPATGTLVFQGGQTFNVFGGTTFVTEGGANDSVVFNNLQFTNGVNSGTLSINYVGIGDRITTNEVTSRNLSLLTLGLTTTNVTLNFNAPSLSSFSATVTGVPEPGSLVALSGLAFGCVAYRVRRKRSASKV